MKQLIPHTHSFHSHSLIYSHSLTRPLTHPLIHSLTHSLTHSLKLPITRPYTRHPSRASRRSCTSTLLCCVPTSSRRSFSISFCVFSISLETEYGFWTFLFFSAHTCSSWVDTLLVGGAAWSPPALVTDWVRPTWAVSTVSIPPTTPSADYSPTMLITFLYKFFRCCWWSSCTSFFYLFGPVFCIW